MSGTDGIRRRTGALMLAAVVGLAAGLAVPRLGGPAEASPKASTAQEVGAAKQELARALAVSLTDAGWDRQVRAALTRGTVDPIALAQRATGPGAAGFRSVAERANRAILAAKGLPARTGSVLELRLAGRTAGASRVAYVAAEVDDDEITTVPAYDRSGREHRLSGRTAPAAPVAVLGVDESRTLAAGLSVVRGQLGRYGVSTGDAAARRGPSAQATGFWTTRVMSVRLSSDEEPWIKGDAEIYAIVSGVGVNGEPQVDIVQMPYLDNDGRWYYPGQILVNWSHFKYNAVDAVMMEEDDGTNYLALAQAIATALLSVLGQAPYAPMVNAILAAIPASWWTDDPDYVDSWYLLTRQTNEVRNGARANGTITYAPYYVTAL